MTLQKFKLDQVIANPYQPRLSEDEEHILSLAKNIAVNTMLQHPVGRMSPDPDKQGSAELAFGHNRLASHKRIFSATPEELAEWGKTFETPEQLNGFYEYFSTIEINILPLTDEEMFQYAVSENQDRKDLTPVEEAIAMHTYRDHFKKTSKEIGVLFHASDSAVRNKMRLLDLPENLRSKVGHGVSEGVARELLVAVDLPECVKEQKLFHPSGDWREQCSLLEYFEKKFAQDGALMLSDVQSKIEEATNRSSTDMAQKPWKNDELLTHRDNNPLPLCKGCSKMLTRDKKVLCLDKACYSKKLSAFQYAYLLKASLLIGVPVCEEDREDREHHTSFDYDETHVLDSLRKKGGCENLRLIYSPSYYGKEQAKITNLVEEGFPDARIVCMKRNGSCTCIKAAKARVDIASGEGEQVSEADRKEMRRQIAEQKKNNKELCEKMTLDGISSIVNGLKAGRISVIRWYCMVNDYQLTTFWRDIDPAKVITLEETYPGAVSIALRSKLYSEEPKDVLRIINQNLKEAGLDPLNIELGEKNLKTPKPVSEKRSEPLEAVASERNTGVEYPEDVVEPIVNIVNEPVYVDVDAD
jgi:ParB family chromosome partitioning protein